MRKPKINGRTFLVYLLGNVILACGVCLNTKTFLGVSPVISVAYNASIILEVSIGQATFVYYCLLILLQFVLLKHKFERFQFLQVFAGFLSSFFIEIFDKLLVVPDDLTWRLFSLLLAITLTGIGASITVAMKILPNPADALAHTVGLVSHKSFGFGKNLLDVICILVSISLGLVFRQDLLGIGIGTVVAMFLTGRIIAICHPWSESAYQHLVEKQISR